MNVRRAPESHGSLGEGRYRRTVGFVQFSRKFASQLLARDDGVGLAPGVAAADFVGEPARAEHGSAS